MKFNVYVAYRDNQNDLREIEIKRAGRVFHGESQLLIYLSNWLGFVDTDPIIVNFRKINKFEVR